MQRKPASLNGAMGDLEAFSSEIAENYFRTVREELKRANPGAYDTARTCLSALTSVGVGDIIHGMKIRFALAVASVAPYLK